MASWEEEGTWEVWGAESGADIERILVTLVNTKKNANFSILGPKKAKKLLNILCIPNMNFGSHHQEIMEKNNNYIYTQC